MNIPIKGLRPLLDHSASVVVLEDGQPAYVLMGWDVYQKLSGIEKPNRQEDLPLGDRPEPVVTRPQVPEPARESQPPQPFPSAQEVEMIDRLNKEILALKEQIEAEERNALGE